MITIHDLQLCEHYMGCKAPKTTSTPSPRTPKKRSQPTTPLNRLNRSASQMVRAQEWLSRKARRNIMELPADPQVQALQQTCHQLRSKERELLQEIEDYLESERTNNQFKKELLYKQWNDRVFLPLYTTLRDGFDDIYPQIDSQRRALFDKYIEYTNRKKVFLHTKDTINYDPFKRLASSVKTRPFNDPLIAQLVDYEAESYVISNCDMGVSRDGKPRDPFDTSHDLEDRWKDPVMWLAVELVYIDSQIRQKSSRQTSTNTRNHAHCQEQGCNEKDLGTKELSLEHINTIVHQVGEINLEWEESQVMKESSSDSSLAGQKTKVSFSD